MSLPSYLQEDDDDEDDEFIPGMDDEGEDEDFSGDEDDESEADKNDIPPFLQGYLMADSTDHRTIIFKENGSFCLKSEGEIPRGWSICSPQLSQPVSFLGWIGDPTKSIKFQIEVLEQDQNAAIDSLDEKFLHAQNEKMKSAPEEEKKSVVFPASANQDQKEAAHQGKCPPPQSMKQPPMLKVAPKSVGNSNSVVYAITGTACHESRAVTFRGVFRPATNTENISSVFIICTTNVAHKDEEHGATTTPSRCCETVAVSKRKRDDDSDNEDSSKRTVDFQELIDIHEDAMRHQ